MPIHVTTLRGGYQCTHNQNNYSKSYYHITGQGKWQGKSFMNLANCL